MKKITLTNDPVDLWSLTDPMPDFQDEYEIFQQQLYTIYHTLGEEFTGSIVGYIEVEKNKDYRLEDSSGQYFANVYSCNGELLQDLGGAAYAIARWGGVRRLPFVGYVYKDKRSENSLPEGTIWIIIPKSKEQLLSAVATFYKRRKKKDEAPNIVDLQEYIKHTSSIGKITDTSSFVPLRKRLMEGKTRLTATKKRIEEFRATAPELTDYVLVEAIKEKYKDLFVNYEDVAEEVVKETYRNELALTIENVLQQLDYLVEDRKLLKYYKNLQEVYNPSSDLLRIREKVNKVIERVYETACNRVCDLSEFADGEVISYLLNDKVHADKGLHHTLNNLCCDYHCRKYDLTSCWETDNYPPFKCFDYRFGKDVTFAPTFEDAKAYHDRMKEQQSQEPKRIVERNQQVKQNGGNGGCLLWIILIPSSIFGLLFSLI